MHIVDRTRSVRCGGGWDSPGEIIRSTQDQYRRDRWTNQPYRPEIWIEKDALVGVFSRVAEEYNVPLFSCRGYTSQSEVWGAAGRMMRHQRGWNHENGEEQQPYVIHFGDHDPSGIDMSRDIQDRLEMFGVYLEFDRMALNFDQVRQYNPPPNPAKLIDSRCRGYMADYGNKSWELDALEPDVLADLVRRHIESIRDEDAWQECLEKEEHEKELLGTIGDRFDDVKEFLDSDNNGSKKS